MGEKVLYFSPRKYQGVQDKWLRKFTGPFEIVKLLGPVNVLLQKTHRSTPFTTHVDKIRKIEIDPNDDSERTQELEANNMGDTAIVVISPAASSNPPRKSEASPRKKVTVPSEARDRCQPSLSSYNVPDLQNTDEEDIGRPRRHRTLPIRFRQ